MIATNTPLKHNAWPDRTSASPAEKILSILLERHNQLPVTPQVIPLNGSLAPNVHYSKIQQFIDDNAKITLVLPAFPAKSPNPEKTLGSLPDLGEVLALQYLNDLCRRIEQIYMPGAELVICSDGRVFSDLVEVSDAEVDGYSARIRKIISDFSLTHLKTYNLEDQFPELSYHEMRSRLVSVFASPLGELHDAVKTEESTRSLFNGIHRFIFEDQLVLSGALSRNQIREKAKGIAYQVIQRSNAWSRLVEQEFPQAVRLSIHPQPFNSVKLGIQLVPCKNRWGTPWHGVVLYNGSHFELVKRKEAEQAGATLATWGGDYSFFTLANGGDHDIN